MPQHIDVPGMGIVEFPDGMSDEAISAAIKQNMPAPQKSFMDKLGETTIGKIGKSIYSAATLPGDVYSGKTAITTDDGHTNPEVINRSAELATLASPTSPKVAASLLKPGAAPAAEDLLKAGAEGYNKARELGIDIKSSGVKSMSDTIQADLQQAGINGKLAPKTFSILEEVSNPPEGAVSTISNLETIRRTLGNAAKDFTNPTEKMAASKAIEHLDDYLANVPARDVLAGDAAQASKVLGEARGNYAAAKRSEKITDAFDAADLQAASANSGQNIGNATRQRIKGILGSDKLSRGYSPEELAQMERLVRGTATGNATRTIGNLLGGGGGLGAMVSAGIGGAATAPYGGIGAAAPAIGFALKQMSNKSTERQARILDELIRSRSPLGEEMKALTAGNESQAARAAIVRALLMPPQQQ